MPEECERVAAIVFRRMFPAVRETRRAPSEKVPGYPFRSYIPRSQGSHVHRTYQTTFFKKFTARSILRQFIVLNCAFYKLAPRRGMPKGENFKPMDGSSGDDRTGFLDAGHSIKMNVRQARCQRHIRVECCLGSFVPSGDSYNPGGLCEDYYEDAL
jgi:hypothetical protein